ncbi:MAG: tRNA uridine-5-carboxymethylaminomethyl(34) synthesis GTPase MnmE [Mycoplasmataceae bacterium]|jgi:tRNA modification GTPase|nr:tRNA uridine-5-carboxymethylaminomethyl(34) synthesis GTPase MnmE [Mycoplasmataceae bacterium]
MNNTIVALATAPMNSAIHIIRVSGPKTYDIVNSITDIKIVKKHYSVQKVKIIDDKKIIDHVLMIKFVAPRSFTGEDTIEINCHGGLFLASIIIKLLIKHGCELAKPGEFSQRAFMNNKLTLLEAESINNLIHAPNATAVQIANNAINSPTHQTLTIFKKTLFTLIGQIEINIDYPEYNDVPQITPIQFEKIISNLIQQIKSIVIHSKQATLYHQGINVAIVGEPNAGKSSLLNAFIHEPRAIVSSAPGTTRDVISERVNINELTLNFLDTAGIRHSRESVEKMGIQKTMQAIDKSELVLYVIDASKASKKTNKNILNNLNNKKYLIVLNKTDLPIKTSIKGIKVSAKHGKISNLINAISKQIRKLDLSDSELVILQSERAIALLEQVHNNLLQIEHLMKKHEPVDLSMELLHQCLVNIQNILGENKTENFYDELFKNFCVGK